MQAAFQISLAGGPIVFGSLEHIQGNNVLVGADAVPCADGALFDFRLELTGRGAWVCGQAMLCSSQRMSPDTSATLRCRILSLASDEDALRLRHWLEETSQGGTSAHPERWLSTLSYSQPSRSREAFNKALREHVRARRQRQLDSTAS